MPCSWLRQFWTPLFRFDPNLSATHQTFIFAPRLSLWIRLQTLPASIEPHLRHSTLLVRRSSCSLENFHYIFSLGAFSSHSPTFGAKRLSLLFDESSCCGNTLRNPIKTSEDVKGDIFVLVCVKKRLNR